MQNIRLNTLQFAAKILEIFTATFLSLVAINKLQYELILGKELSVGSVIVSFEINNLGSPSGSTLWKKLFIRGLIKCRVLFTALLLLLVILCAKATQPKKIVMLDITTLFLEFTSVCNHEQAISNYTRPPLSWCYFYEV